MTRECVRLKLFAGLFLCAAGLWGAGSAAAADAAEEQRPAPTITVRPEDNAKALVNPYMGWTMQFYSNIPENYGSKLEPSDTVEDFPGLSTVYLRVPWAFLEPEEGKFNWALFDTPAQRWIAGGKGVALRVTCSEKLDGARDARVGAPGGRQRLSLRVWQGPQ